MSSSVSDSISSAKTKWRTALVATMCLISVAPVEAREDRADLALSPVWDLKGVRLGASIDEVSALFPQSKCETESFDSGLTTCTDWNNSLAGQKALVIVKFLDGRAVYVCVDNLNLAQARAAAVALIEKLGAASATTRVEGQENARQRNSNRWVYADQFTWLEGQTELRVDPFSWTDNKRQITFAAVVLKDRLKHDQEWITRYKAGGQKASDI